MNTPETYKNIEVDGRKFRLKKMDARTASYILFTKGLSLITPLLKNIKFDSIDNFQISDLDISLLSDALNNISEKDFRFIQDNALQTVYEILDAGEAPVLNANGSWGINDIAFNGALIMTLTIQSLYFNIKGFFPESLLESLRQKLTSPQPN
ncbi:phage tail assembly chaperone [Clostridium saccharoperbutylacetonicum]|uniref:phage tail assembly chaperone n=1 Tax=Clostridium saccharoperbutylacetonicum TaxID=36745 RepID=UPI0039EAA167